MTLIEYRNGDVWLRSAPLEDPAQYMRENPDVLSIVGHARIVFKPEED